MWLLLACAPDPSLPEPDHPLRDADDVVAEDSAPGLSLGDVFIDFDDLPTGTTVGEHYAAEGVHLLGGGAPGEALDTSVVGRGGDCTQAELRTEPNVLCAHVNEGFNHAGDPGFAGWLDEPAEAVTIRVYNGGLTGDADTDQATLTVYGADGALGSHVGRAETARGQEWVDLVVEAAGITRFEVLTGDFDAVDDLGIWRDGPPIVGDQPDEPQDTGSSSPGDEWVCAEEIRNGSEICDDAKFRVPDPYTPLAIQCVTGLGGVGYVSSNTGPTMSDGIARCQGWEENGQDAWDHLDYLDKVVCNTEGQVHEIDLSAWAGQDLWVGVHDLPEGGGHFTHVCIAHLQ